MKFNSRIVGTGNVSPDELLANPFNHRIHSQHQQEVLESVLDEVGWVQQVIVNTNTGHMIDGHCRVKLAMRHNVTQVPVVYVDLSETEERKVLATFDHITGLAGTDKDILKQLTEGLTSERQVLDELISSMRSDLPVAVINKDKQAVAKGVLKERYLWQPFTFLDTRRTEWQARKQLWRDLGIQSELGRDAVHSSLTSAHVVKSGHEGSGWAQTSIFDPALCELMYTWFSAQGGAVLDPFAGGSVRGIVAGMLGREYIGVDLRQEQVSANEAQAKQISPEVTPKWVCGDSLQVVPELPDNTFDFVFSCPPYADLERYSDDPADLSTMPYQDFLVAYHHVIQQCYDKLQNNRFACFVVGEVRSKKGGYYNFVGDTVQAFIDAGFTYYNEAILVTQEGTLPVRAAGPFEKSRKLGKQHQNVLVFVKGDPVAATKACGAVDILSEVA